MHVLLWVAVGLMFTLSVALLLRRWTIEPLFWMWVHREVKKQFVDMGYTEEHASCEATSIVTKHRKETW